MSWLRRSAREAFVGISSKASLNLMNSSSPRPYFASWNALLKRNSAFPKNSLPNGRSFSRQNRSRHSPRNRFDCRSKIAMISSSFPMRRPGEPRCLSRAIKSCYNWGISKRWTSSLPGHIGNASIPGASPPISMRLRRKADDPDSRRCSHGRPAGHCPDFRH
jgi:hypothetical protein